MVAEMAAEKARYYQQQKAEAQTQETMQLAFAAKRQQLDAKLVADQRAVDMSLREQLRALEPDGEHWFKAAAEEDASAEAESARAAERANLEADAEGAKSKLTYKLGIWWMQRAESETDPVAKEEALRQARMYTEREQSSRMRL